MQYCYNKQFIVWLEVFVVILWHIKVPKHDCATKLGMQQCTLPLQSNHDENTSFKMSEWAPSASFKSHEERHLLSRCLQRQYDTEALLLLCCYWEIMVRQHFIYVVISCREWIVLTLYCSNFVLFWPKQHRKCNLTPLSTFNIVWLMRSHTIRTFAIYSGMLHYLVLLSK